MLMKAIYVYGQSPWPTELRGQNNVMIIPHIFVFGNKKSATLAPDLQALAE
jgi:hypothetical protein